MSGTTPGWRQQPSPEQLIKFQTSYRRKQALLFGGLGALFVLWIVVIAVQPSERVIVAVWAAFGVYAIIGGLVLWRCPRCGFPFGRRWRVDRCDHCWLELDPRKGPRAAD